MVLIVIDAPPKPKAKTPEEEVTGFLKRHGYNVEAVRQTKLGSVYFNSACAGATSPVELLDVLAKLSIVNPLYRSRP
jgi:hypothetical protein